jgi:hypothetical protein
MLKQTNPVKPSGDIPKSSRIERNASCSYSVTVFGSAFCLAQSPLTAPFCFIELAAKERIERKEEATEGGSSIHQSRIPLFQHS